MQQWLSKTELLKRGWSATLITKLLPSPLSTGKATRRSGSLSHVWPLDLVEQQEATEVFQCHLSRKQEKTERTPHAKQRQYLLSLVERCHIYIPCHSYTQIKKATLESVREREVYKDDPKYANHASIIRWQVNYIRHELTCYDDICKRLVSCVGEQQAHRMLKNKVLALIAQTYPKFRAECHRQMLPSDND